MLVSLNYATQLIEKFVVECCDNMASRFDPSLLFVTLNHKKHLIHNRQKYTRSAHWPFNSGLESYRWDCSVDGCNAKIYTHHKSNKITHYGNHSDYPLLFHKGVNHGSYSETDFIRDKSIDGMIQLVNNGTSPRDACEQEILNDIRVCYAWSGFEAVRRTLYYRRASYYPSLPENKEGIYDTIMSNECWRWNHWGYKRRQFDMNASDYANDMQEYKTEEDINNKIHETEQDIISLKQKLSRLQTIKSIQFGSSINDESVLYLGCNDDASFQVFGDKFGYERLVQCQWRLFDATFSITPKISWKSTGKLIPYYQCWIIHAVHDCEDENQVSECLPCIYVLMTRGKMKQKDYENVLDFVIVKGIELFDIDISQTSPDCMADFEGAERNAIISRQNPRGGCCKGCGFHHCQGCLSNIKKKKLYMNLEWSL